jgi:hypothetical protein
MGATVEGESDVSEKTIRWCNHKARQVADPVRGLKRRFAGPFDIEKVFASMW